MGYERPRPRRLGQGDRSRVASGKAIDPESPRAACWCLNGAIDKCYPAGDKRVEARKKLMSAIRSRRSDCSSITWFNDYQAKKFADVKAVMEAADI